MALCLSSAMDCFLCSLFLKKTILQKEEDALVIQTLTAAYQVDMDSRGDRPDWSDRDRGQTFEKLLNI